MARKIVVIGDVMLDRYDYCRRKENPEKKSVPCWVIERVDYKPGGAGNTAANLISLGSECELISIIGEDPDAEELKRVLDNSKIPHRLIVDKKRPTIVKERIMIPSTGDYDGRLDQEKKRYITSNHVSEILSNMGDCSMILVSDYNKGMISEHLMSELKKTGIPVILDPKPEHKSSYKGVFLIKPNLKEIREMTGIKNALEATEVLSKELETRVLLTRGKYGINYLGLDGKRINLKSEAKKVADATGAGDTVIATFSHFLNKGKSLEESIMLANIAAGIAVSYPGCYPVTEKEIFEGLEKKEIGSSKNLGSLGKDNPKGI